jgi:ferredoxin
MRVTVDTSMCTGHGRCYSLAPDVFVSDEDGFSVVKVADVPPELEAQARTAEASCPERAITLS